MNDYIPPHIEELLDPRELAKSVGLPHPLSNFAIAGRIVDDLYADVLLDCIQDSVSAEPDSYGHKGALWLLLESKNAFFFACDGAGIDGEKLREHLRRVMRKYRGDEE